ncbi:MAG: glycoside hydrolase family 9 protein [Chitinispirillaceae bacterium]
MKRLRRCLVLIAGASLLTSLSAAIHVNEVGYEPGGAKTAIIQDTTGTGTFSSTFSVQDTQGEEVFSGEVNETVTVEGWEGRAFAVCDFSALDTEGTYTVVCGDESSEPFLIADNVLFSRTVADQVGFFQGMRAAPDEHTDVPKFGEDGSSYDVRGGWYDATGDRGKYLSHLSFANYMNPQQIPMVIWSLLRSYELNETFISEQDIPMTEEAAYGADYLMRVLDDDGYFYQIIFNRWGHAEDGYHICSWHFDPTAPEYAQTGIKNSNYQCAFREGGGIAIAALAKAYEMGVSGEFTAQQYLDGAQRAYEHLLENNLQYCDNGEENIIDDYCALMAAVELYKATSESGYLADARSRAESLIERFDDQGFFFSDDARNRPYYHAAEEGLPIIALIEYRGIDNSKDAAIFELLQKWKTWYLELADEVSNPFNYARMFWAEPNSSGPGQIEGGNLALNKPAEASTVEGSLTPDMAVDGQTGNQSRWGSQLYDDPEDMSCDEWITVDLGQACDIDKVLLNWETAFAPGYTIDVSEDGSSWTTVFTEENGDGGTDEIAISPAARARYVRMHANRRDLAYAGVSLYEFQISGSVYVDPDAPEEPIEGHTSFFQPHTNETGYWWQGDNARLSSMAAAFLWAEMSLDPAFRIGDDDVSRIALAQLDWILGKNPFGMCMMYGYGKTNYPDYTGIEAFPNIKGGICNGITSDMENETDIEYMPHGNTTDDWRWTEQWLPHNAWYLFASATLSYVNDREVSSIDHPITTPRSRQPQAVFGAAGISLKAKGGTARVVIMDLQGRKVAQRKLSGSGMLSYESLKLSSGAYIATVQTNSIRQTQRFYINR